MKTKITPTKSVLEGWNGTVKGLQALADALDLNTASKPPYLNKFDRMVVQEAYSRVEGLQYCVQRGIEGWEDELAHQTGYRASWLSEHAKEVRSI